MMMSPDDAKENQNPKSAAHSLLQRAHDVGYLVINNTSHSKNIIDKIFWYNSNKHIPDFKMGSYDFWDFSAKM